MNCTRAVPVLKKWIVNKILRNVLSLVPACREFEHTKWHVSFSSSNQTDTWYLYQRQNYPLSHEIISPLTRSIWKKVRNEMTKRTKHLGDTQMRHTYDHVLGKEWRESKEVLLCNCNLGLPKNQLSTRVFMFFCDVWRLSDRNFDIRAPQCFQLWILAEVKPVLKDVGNYRRYPYQKIFNCIQWNPVVQAYFMAASTILNQGISSICRYVKAFWSYH